MLYISNDFSKEDFSGFYDRLVEEANWCTLPWNSPLIISVKNEFRLEALPRVLVLDRNLELVTAEGADDVLNLEP